MDRELNNRQKLNAYCMLLKASRKKDKNLYRNIIKGNADIYLSKMWYYDIAYAKFYLRWTRGNIHCSKNVYYKLLKLCVKNKKSV